MYLRRDRRPAPPQVTPEEPHPIHFVHKGKCDAAFYQRTGIPGTKWLSEELPQFLNYLTHNTNDEWPTNGLIADIRRGDWDVLIARLLPPASPSERVHGAVDYEVAPIPLYLADELEARRRRLLRGNTSA